MAKRQKMRKHIKIESEGSDRPETAPVSQEGEIQLTVGYQVKREDVDGDEYATSKQTSSVVIKREAGDSDSAGPKRCKTEHEHATTAQEVTSTSEGTGPRGWRTVWENILEMRRLRNAPVDTMGCERLFDPEAPPHVQRFHILVGLMLSSQTKDETTSAAVLALRKHGLTVPNIIATPAEKVSELICKVGFWRRKTEYLKKTAEILHEKYGDDIPDTLEGLMDLPGVGVKMATIAMNVAHGRIQGIGVDTHVHRIANRLKWTRRTTATPELTQKALEDWMPRELWSEVNIALVGFGQQICRPVGPLCSLCLNRDLCPSSTARTIRRPTATVPATEDPIVSQALA